MHVKGVRSVLQFVLRYLINTVDLISPSERIGHIESPSLPIFTGKTVYSIPETLRTAQRGYLRTKKT